MQELIVKSQQELDAVKVDYNGRIIIAFGDAYNRAVVSKRYKYPVVARGNSSVVARGNSSVVAWENSSVVAWENSSVVARGNSSVVAWENSSVVAWENSSVVAWGNSSVEARENSSVVARGNSSVVARGNSSVVAWDNSSVEAWENSSVVAWDNSSVEAWDNSSVEAWENSSVVARGNSSVVAWENSSVVARGNSSVVAWGNVQVVDAARKNNVKISGNARAVYNPSTIEEWAETNGRTIQDGKIRLYKAVHKVNNQFIADWDRSFEYIPGKAAVADGFNSDPEEDCGKGIHMATLAWAAMYGQAWDDIALLELEASANEVIVPLYETGKVRAPKALVIREVPLEEAGLMGKIIAKRRKA